MSGIADDVVELLDGYQHALADAAIVRGADPDAAWNEREYAVGKIAELEAENAKLRELVRIAGTYCVNGLCGKDDGCPLYLGKPYCALPDRMRDLGIEVDDCE